MRILFAILFLCLPAVAGTPAQAEAIRTAYEKSAEAFQLRLKLAKTDAERAEALKRAPDARQAAERMWQVIGGDLSKPWTLEPAGWFMRVIGSLTEPGEDGQPQPAMRAQAGKIREAVRKYHMESDQLMPVCVGLVAVSGKESLDLLREITDRTKNKEIGGVAALGVAMLVKTMGDDPRLMRERLSMLRRAIIDSADVAIDDTTVAEMAEEELYIIMSLTKGVQAPELEGADSGGRPMKLADFAGKVLLLVFWESAGEQSDGLLEWVEALLRDERFMGKDFEVVGVHTGPQAALRKLQADGRVTWPNFSDPQGELAKVYRIQNRPTAYVLGPDRKIHFIGSIGTFAELTAAAILDEQ